MADDPTYRHRPLEPPENGEFRDIRDGWQFRRRLFGSINKGAAWILAVVVGTAAFHKNIGDIIQWLVGINGGGP